MQGNPSSPVNDKKIRRKFSAEYKLKILAEAETCTEPGQINALLERERLYSSNLSAWRRERNRGLTSAMKPKKRGPKVGHDASLTRRLAALERENQRLQQQLKNAELTINAQKEHLKVVLAQPTHEAAHRDKLMSTAALLSDDVGKKAACDALQVSRASFYRFLGHPPPAEKKRKKNTG